MFERILRQLREKIQTHQYVMTIHAVGEMDDDGLTIFDIERGILTGEIIERQKDSVTGEYKYLVKGRTNEDDEVVVVTKLSPTGRLVIITVFVE
jgi:Domain of unknown function (DUF4258)